MDLDQCMEVGESECEMSPHHRTIGFAPNGSIAITIGRGLGGSGSGSLPFSFSSGVPDLEPELDPSLVSYEEGARQGDQFVTSLENRYETNRHEIMTEDGIHTPLSVLRQLAREQEKQVHFESHEIRITDHLERYQVEIILDNFKGVGEANHKKLASQIAAADLLENYKRAGGQVPQFGMIPGFRINPGIFADLASLCQALKVPRPIFVELPPESQAMKPPLYTYKCQIGQLITTGYSDSRNVAKRYVAKKMFETLSGEKIELDRVEYGPYSRIFKRYNITKRTSKLKEQLIEEIRSRPCSGPGSVTTEVETDPDCPVVDDSAAPTKTPAGWRNLNAFYYSDEEEGDEEEEAIKMKDKRLEDPENVLHQLTKAAKLKELEKRLEEFNLC